MSPGLTPYVLNTAVTAISIIFSCNNIYEVSFPTKEETVSLICVIFRFLMQTIFKVFIEFVTILLLFYVLVSWPQGTWDFSFLIRNKTSVSCLGRQNLNHWTSREVPANGSLYPCLQGNLTPVSTEWTNSLGHPCSLNTYSVHLLSISYILENTITAVNNSESNQHKPSIRGT